ncbi:MAG: hypothetical protein OEY86_14830, partial [Nitrospira sp.]|nr:hypothetical protein [Nitrospira sp.]
PLPPPVTKEELKVVQAQESGVKVSEVVRIEGGMLIGGRAVWVDDKGEFLTMNDLVMRTGASVTERIENGKLSISGPGIVWGGLPSAEVEKVLPKMEPEESPVLDSKQNPLVHDPIERGDYDDGSGGY